MRNEATRNHHYSRKPHQRWQTFVFNKTVNMTLQGFLHPWVAPRYVLGPLLVCYPLRVSWGRGSRLRVKRVHWLKVAAHRPSTSKIFRSREADVHLSILPPLRVVTMVRDFARSFASNYRGANSLVLWCVWWRSLLQLVITMLWPRTMLGTCLP